MENMAEMMGDLATRDGLNPTHLPGVEIYRVSRHQEPTPLQYKKGIVIIGQGSKSLLMGNRRYEYNHENFLVFSVSLPMECEIFATEEKPLLSLYLNIDMGDLGRTIDKMERHGDRTSFLQDKNQPGLLISKTTGDIRDCACRLLGTLKSPVESEVLGRGLVIEILYRILISESAPSLYSLFIRNSNLSRVDKAIEQIHRNYHRAMSVDELATMVNMSVSSFHRAFKEVTAIPPIQYIKKVRLHKARDLFMEQGRRVGEVALAVGYESASQFSREFKRFFGESPANLK